MGFINGHISGNSYWRKGFSVTFQHSSGEIVLRMGRMAIVSIECNFGLTYFTLSIAMTLLQKRLLLPVMTLKDRPIPLQIMRKL